MIKHKGWSPFPVYKAEWQEARRHAIGMLVYWYVINGKEVERAQTFKTLQL